MIFCVLLNFRFDLFDSSHPVWWKYEPVESDNHVLPIVELVTVCFSQAFTKCLQSLLAFITM